MKATGHKDQYQLGEDDGEKETEAYLRIKN